MAIEFDLSHMTQATRLRILNGQFDESDLGVQWQDATLCKTGSCDVFVPMSRK